MQYKSLQIFLVAATFLNFI